MNVMKTERILTSFVPDQGSNHAYNIHGEWRPVVEGVVGIIILIEDGEKGRAAMIETVYARGHALDRETKHV
jgi:hypothetical protein